MAAGLIIIALASVFVILFKVFDYEYFFNARFAALDLVHKRHLVPAAPAYP
jgi:hypothetical protein